MEMKRQDAFDVLRGWQADERVVQCGVNIGATRISQILGRVDTVSEAFIHVSASRLEMQSGDQFWVTIHIVNISHYEYIEGHEVPPDYLPNVLEERYKGMIGLECRDGVKIALLAFKSGGERQQEVG